MTSAKLVPSSPTVRALRVDFPPAVVERQQTIHRATFVNDRPSATGGGSASLSLPEDIRAVARRRTGWVALLLAALFGSFLVLSVILILTGHPEWPAPVDVTLFVLSLGVYTLTRVRRVSDRAISLVGLAFMTLVVGLIQIGNIGGVWREHGHVPGANFGTVLIVALPLIVPTRPRYAIVAAGVAAATAPLGVFLLTVIDKAVMRPYDYLYVSVLSVAAALMAILGSRLVHGMGLEVAKARQLGAYRLTTLLGRGGMGEVWRGEHRMLARPAAIKLISPTEDDLVEARLKRFEREAQVTSRLRSPHTVELYDFGVAADGAVYYAMELLDGVDLETLVRDDGPQAAERVIHILVQMCHSLHEAHRAGLVHRDIKPPNTFICRYGEDWDFVKVLDFGLVSLQPQREASQSEKLTQDNSLQGTPACMAPEMIVDPDNVGPSADIYALGCVAYWLLAGRLVFEGASVVEVLADHIHAQPKPPSAVQAGVPADLEALVLACLAKDPEKRPASAARLADELGACEASGLWTQDRARDWWSSYQRSPESNTAPPVSSQSAHQC